jgi:hypothetical protein
MKDFEIKSIQVNLDTFLKGVDNDSFLELVDWICCHSLSKPLSEHPPLAKKFAIEFIGEKEYTNLYLDSINPEVIFFKADFSTRELIRHMRIALMQESYFRLKAANKQKPKQAAKSSEITLTLNKADHKNLIEILVEHEAMLRYQLEDTDAIRETDKEQGEKLVKEKIRHQGFLRTFLKLK